MSEKYESHYSHGKQITPAQYIAEIMCEKKAKLQGKDLPQKFWTIKPWEAYFRMQVTMANRLLKKWSDVAIVRALRSQAAFNIYSLGAPHLVDIIRSEQTIVDTKAAALKDFVPVVRPDVTAQPRKIKSKRNALSALKELDNGEEES